MSDYKLDGRFVKIFTTGGWEFSGKVVFQDDTKIVLDEGEEFLVLYREKIDGARILREIFTEDIVEPITIPQYHNNRGISQQNDELNLNLMEHEHYGTIIPEDMLEGSSEKDQISFSVSFSDLKNAGERSFKNDSREKVKKPGEKD